MITMRNHARKFSRLVASWALTLLLSAVSGWAQNSVSQQPVDFSSYYNVNGINTDGTATSNGGFDNDGYAYSETAMQNACTSPQAPAPPYVCSGTYPNLSFAEPSATVSFTFGPPNAPDAVTGAGAGSISLPAGVYTELQMIGAGVNNAQTGQKVVVNYTDGTSSTVAQTFGDWYSSQCSDAGEVTALATAYRLTPTGSTDNRTFYLCLYNLAIDPTKTVSTLVLPNNRNVIIMAATLVAIPGFATAAGTPSALTVSAGSSITIPATATSEANYSGTVNFACSVSPAIQPTQSATAPTCTFSPSSVSVAPGTVGTSTVTFTPASPASTALAKRSSGLIYAFWLGIPGLAVVAIGARSRTSRRKRLFGFLLLGLLLAGILILPACVTYTHLGNVGTPPGQYTIIITGTDAATNSPQLGSGGSVVVTVQ